MQTFNRIDWKRGMEIMPETFTKADDYHDSVSLVNRQVLVPFTYGLVPLHDFELKYSLNYSSLTLEKLSCTILACDGSLLQLTQGVNVPLPKDAQGTYYLAVSCGEPNHTEKSGVPMLEKTYKYQIINLLNPNSPSLFPLMKLYANNGEWEVVDFIPPCCAVGAHAGLATLTNQCRQWMDKVLQLTGQQERTEAYYRFGLLLVEFSNTIHSDSPFMLVTRLKKAVFILKSEHLLDESDTLLLDRAEDFIWNEFTPNTLFETLQEALSIIHAAVDYLQQNKQEPAPVVEKPQEPEEEEFTYML